MALGIGSTTSASTSGTFTSNTRSYTCSSGTDRLLVVRIEWATGSTFRTVSTVRYNGIDLTEAVALQNAGGDDIGVAIWYLKDADFPANGTYNVVTTWSGSLSDATTQIRINTFTGVTQTSLSNTDTQSTDNSTSFSKTVSGLNTSKESWVIDCIGCNDGTLGSGINPDSPQVEQGSSSSGGILASGNLCVQGASYEDAGTSSSVSMGWSGADASTADWAGVFLELIDSTPLSVSPSKDSLSLAENAPTFHKTLKPALASLSLSVNAVFVSNEDILTPQKVSLAMSANAPSFMKSISATLDSLSLSANAIDHMKKISVSQPSLSLSANAVSITAIWVNITGSGSVDFVDVSESGADDDFTEVT